MHWRLDDGQIEVIDEAQAEALRRRTPAQRVAMIGACNRTMRLLIEGRLRSRHPEWEDETVHTEVVRRMTLGSGVLPGRRIGEASSGYHRDHDGQRR